MPSESQIAADIYVVDVEGGNATLFVSPSGESMLIDSGNTGCEMSRTARSIVDVFLPLPPRPTGKVADERLKRIQQHVNLLSDEFPPEKVGEYCNEQGRDVIRHYIAELRRS